MSTPAAESAQRAPGPVTADTDRGVISAQMPSPADPSTADPLADRLTSLKLDADDASSDNLSDADTETPDESGPTRGQDVIEQIMRSLRANLDLKLEQVKAASSTPVKKEAEHQEEAAVQDESSEAESRHESPHDEVDKAAEGAKEASTLDLEEETMSASAASAASGLQKAKKSSSLLSSIRSPRRLFQKRAVFQPEPTGQSQISATSTPPSSAADLIPPTSEVSLPSSASTSTTTEALSAPSPSALRGPLPPPPPPAPKIYPGLALASASALAATGHASLASASTPSPKPNPAARLRKASAAPVETTEKQSEAKGGVQQREKASDSTKATAVTEGFSSGERDSSESAPAPTPSFSDYRPLRSTSFQAAQDVPFAQPLAARDHISTFGAFAPGQFPAATARPIAPRAAPPPPPPPLPEAPLQSYMPSVGGGGHFPLGGMGFGTNEPPELLSLLQGLPQQGHFPSPSNDPTSAISPLDLQQALFAAEASANPFMGMGLMSNAFVQHGMPLPELENRRDSVSSPETPNRNAQQQPVTPQSMSGRVKHDQDWEEGVASDHDGRRKKQRRGAEKAATGAKKFACPYFKRNRRKYSKWTSCPGPGWDEVHRVKTHLYRRHALPIQCPRCWEMFKTEDALKVHLQVDARCEVRENRSMVEGFNKDQEKKLRSRKKATADTTDEDKWREIYMILFPDDDPASIPTPYYDSTDYDVEDSASPKSGELEDYTTFVRREMPTLVRRELENLFDSEFQDIEAHLRPRVAEIVLKLQPKLLGLYKQSQMPLSEYGPPSNEPVINDPSLTPATSHRTGTDQGSTPTTDPYLPPSTDFTFDHGGVLDFDNTGLGLGGWDQPLQFDGGYGDEFSWDNDFKQLLNPAVIMGGDRANLGWHPQGGLGQGGYSA